MGAGNSVLTPTAEENEKARDLQDATTAKKPKKLIRREDAKPMDYAEGITRRGLMYYNDTTIPDLLQLELDYLKQDNKIQIYATGDDKFGWIDTFNDSSLKIHFDINKTSKEQIAKYIKDNTNKIKDENLLFSLIINDDGNIFIPVKYDELQESGLYKIWANNLYIGSLTDKKMNLKFKYYYAKSIATLLIRMMRSLYIGDDLKSKTMVYNRDSWFEPWTLKVSAITLNTSLESDSPEKMGVILAVEILHAMIRNKTGDDNNKPPIHHSQFLTLEFKNRSDTNFMNDHYLMNKMDTEYIDRLLWVCLEHVRVIESVDEFIEEPNIVEIPDEQGHYRILSHDRDISQMESSVHEDCVNIERAWTKRAMNNRVKDPNSKVFVLSDPIKGFVDCTHMKDTIFDYNTSALLWCGRFVTNTDDVTKNALFNPQIPVVIMDVNQNKTLSDVDSPLPFIVQVNCAYKNHDAKVYSLPHRSPFRNFYSKGGESRSIGSDNSTYLALKNFPADHKRMSPASCGYAIIDPSVSLHPWPYNDDPKSESSYITRVFSDEIFQVHRKDEFPVCFFSLNFPKNDSSDAAAASTPLQYEIGRDWYDPFVILQSKVISEKGPYFDFATLMKREGLVPKHIDYINFLKFQGGYHSEAVPRVLVVDLSHEWNTPELLQDYRIDPGSILRNILVPNMSHRCAVALILNPEHIADTKIIDKIIRNESDNIFIFYSSEKMFAEFGYSSSVSNISMMYTYMNSWTKRNLVRYLKMLGKPLRSPFLKSDTYKERNPVIKLDSMERGSYSTLGNINVNEEDRYIPFLDMSAEIAYLSNPRDSGGVKHSGFLFTKYKRYQQISSRMLKSKILSVESTKYFMDNHNNHIQHDFSETNYIPDDMLLKLYVLHPPAKNQIVHFYPRSFSEYLTNAFKSGYSVRVEDSHFAPRKKNNSEDSAIDYDWRTSNFKVPDYRKSSSVAVAVDKDDLPTGYITDIAYALDNHKWMHTGIYQSVMFISEKQLMAHENEEMESFKQYRSGSPITKDIPMIPARTMCFISEDKPENRLETHLNKLYSHWKNFFSGKEPEGHLHGWIVYYGHDKIDEETELFSHQDFTSFNGDNLSDHPLLHKYPDFYSHRQIMNKMLIQSTFREIAFSRILRKEIVEIPRTLWIGTEFKEGISIKSGVHPLLLKRIRVSQAFDYPETQKKIYYDKLAREQQIYSQINNNNNAEAPESKKLEILDFRSVNAPKAIFVSDKMLVVESYSSRYDHFFCMENYPKSRAFMKTSEDKQVDLDRNQLIPVIEKGIKNIFGKSMLHLGLVPSNVYISPGGDSLLIAGLESVVNIKESSKNENHHVIVDQDKIMIRSPYLLPPEILVKLSEQRNIRFETPGVDLKDMVIEYLDSIWIWFYGLLYLYTHSDFAAESFMQWSESSDNLITRAELEGKLYITNFRLKGWANIIKGKETNLVDFLIDDGLFLVRDKNDANKMKNMTRINPVLRGDE